MLRPEQQQAFLQQLLEGMPDVMARVADWVKPDDEYS